MTVAELRVTVFSDYICPFCYVGHHRLMRLRDHYDLRINWCFVEIHPETSAGGEPVAALDYPSEQWSQLMNNLANVAREEGIPIVEHTFTTNSRDALLLAEVAKESGRDKFYDLHEKLFTAFFVDCENIGDRDILREIAHSSGIHTNAVESAWQEERYLNRIMTNYQLARRLDIQAVPSFIFGERKLTGVVSEDVMRSAAREMLELTTN